MSERDDYRSRTMYGANFWDKVQPEPNSGCYLWLGAVSSAGYGLQWHEGKCWQAHRLAYLKTFGELPSHLFVCHKCDNRLCVRPEHLFLGTNMDNLNDAISKGRLKRTEEMNRRSAERGKKQWADPETRARSIAAVKSPERAKKISAALSGRKKSAQWVANWKASRWPNH